MRVCDSSCRRLAAIERRLPEAAEMTVLIQELREHAERLPKDTSSDINELLLRAAETLEDLHRATSDRGRVPRECLSRMPPE